MYPATRSPEPVVGRACSGCTLRLARPELVEGRARSGCTCRTASSRLVLRRWLRTSGTPIQVLTGITSGDWGLGGRRRRPGRTSYDCSVTRSFREVERRIQKAEAEAADDR